MFRRLPGYIFIVLLFAFVLLSFKIDNTKAASGGNQPCGNGVCQASQGENATTCPADCGVIPTPTPTPNPTLTPNPTTTPAPTTQPTTNPTANPTSGPTPTSQPQSTTPSATNNSTGSSTTSQQSNVNISLNTYPGSVVSGETVNFSGTSSGVDSVEYRVNGGGWQIASGTGNFSFSLNGLEDGDYFVEVRGKYGNNYTGSINTNFTLVNTAPTLTINLPQEPSSDTNLEITGTFSSALPVTVQVSIDGGNTWLPTTISGNKFTSLLPELEDGNFNILVRAIDSLGNTTVSSPQTLVIDTLPPILGTQILSTGPIIISPKNLKDYPIVAGTSFDLILSFAGGPIKVTANIDGKDFDLEKIGSSNLWAGKVKTETKGEFDVNIKAVDGAGNNLEKHIGEFSASDQGNIDFADEVTLSVYSKDFESNSWNLWDGAIYGQSNPKNVKGKYSFYLPSGTYYLESTAKGYQKSQSKIFTLDKPSLVNFDIPMKKLSGINFLRLFIPNYFDPEFKFTSEIEEDTQIPSPKGIKIKDGILVVMDTWSPSSYEQALAINSLSKLGKDNFKVLFIQTTKQKAASFMRRGKYDFEYEVDTTGETLGDTFANSPTFFVFENSKIVEIYQGFLSTNDLIAEVNKLK